MVSQISHSRESSRTDENKNGGGGGLGKLSQLGEEGEQSFVSYWGQAKSNYEYNVLSYKENLDPPLLRAPRAGYFFLNCSK